MRGQIKMVSIDFIFSVGAFAPPMVYIASPLDQPKHWFLNVTCAKCQCYHLQPSKTS